MQLWFPQQIVEPFGLEFHMSRRLEKDILLSSAFSVDIDNIDARVSLNDIVLIQSIMAQRALILNSNSNSRDSGDESSAEAVALARSQMGSEQSEQYRPRGLTSYGGSSDPLSPSSYAEKTPPAQVQLTAYTIDVNVGCVKIVTINDFNGQNLPVLRTLLDGALFHADGVPQQLEGKGNFIFCAEFYNNHIALWEPLIDRWKPELKLTTNETGAIFEVFSKYTLQVSVTGQMLDRLLQTYSILLRSHEISPERRAEVFCEL